MAAFSTNVIEMPDLASRAFQMYQIGLSQQEKAEEKAKLEQEKQALKRERVSDIEGTRGMLEKAYSLEPAAREAASLIFKEYENAAINFNTTGSDTDKSRMNDLRGKFSQVIGQGMAIAEQKKREAEEYRLNPQMFTPDSSRIFEDRMKPIASFKPRVDENGILLGTYQGKEMPLMEIPYFGNEIIPGVNALGLDRIDRTVEILSPDAIAKVGLDNFINSKDVRRDLGGSVVFNKENLFNKVNNWLDGELSLPGAMDKLYISHATSQGGVDPTKMSRSQYLQILDKYKNPELAKQATEWWRQGVLDRVENMIPAAQVGAPRGGGEDKLTESERERNDFVQSLGIPYPDKDVEGKDVIMWDNANIEVKPPETLGSLGEQQYIKSFGLGKDGKYRFVITDANGKQIKKSDGEWNSSTYQSVISTYLRKMNLESDYKRQAQALLGL